MSILFVYLAVPTIMIPEVTAITTDTRPPCINLIPTNTVKSITRPPIIKTIHWKIEGTIRLPAAKKMGKSIVQKNTI